MRLRVCGCHGGETRDGALTGFVLDDTVAIDAGSLTRALTLDEQLGLEHLLLSHSHLDHLKDLAFLAINRLGLTPRPLEVWGSAATLTAARRHLLDEPLWVDVTRLPSPAAPCVRLFAFEDETPFQAGAYACLPIATRHPVPGAALVVRGQGGGAFCFSGDTGPTERLWQVLDATTDLRALIVEVSFPDELAEVALRSGHLTPRLLGLELAKLRRRRYPVWLSHLKPGHEARIHEQVAALGLDDCDFLRDGQVLEI